MRKLGRVAVVLATVIAGLGIGGPARAHDTGPPPEANCFIWWAPHVPFDNWVRACFEANGDKLWVEDRNPDGHSVKAFFVTARGWVGDCRNAHGAGTWHACGFSWIDEQDDIRYRICLTEGSEERPIACTSDAEFKFVHPFTCWLRADSGFGTPGGCDVPRAGNQLAAPRPGQREGAWT